MTLNTNILSSNLKRLRGMMSQTELSTKSGIAQCNISNIEQGKTNPTYMTLLRLSLALEVKLQDLFREE